MTDDAPTAFDAAAELERLRRINDGLNKLVADSHVRCTQYRIVIAKLLGMHDPKACSTPEEQDVVRTAKMLLGVDNG